MPLLECQNIVRAFDTGAGKLAVLKGVSLSLEQGEAATILGSSGAGKSTLLHVLGIIDPPDEGKVLLEGRDVYALSDREQAALRNHKLGFVFQFYHLMGELTALENVLLPAKIAHRNNSQATARAKELLAAVGLGDRFSHFPAQLSGGEQQRAAIARALVNDPILLLADEPTGNLDRANSEMVAALLYQLQKELGFAMLFVTHNREIAGTGRTLLLRDGLLTASDGTILKEKA